MKPQPPKPVSFFPREHGATAMLLSPFVCAAILARRWHAVEIAALAAVAVAFALKDPLVTLARQRWIWKDRHPETAVALRWASSEWLLLLMAGAVFLWFRPARAVLPLAGGAMLFGVLAVAFTLKNKQRSEWFQVASAVALTSTSLVACVAALGEIPRWGWLLWMLCALQATAGIFVVHARLDARIAARSRSPASVSPNRRAALVSIAVLTIAAAGFLIAAFFWIAAALAIAAAGYAFELRRQRDPSSLQMPLQRVGQQALSLSILYGVLIIVGLW